MVPIASAIGQYGAVDVSETLLPGVGVRYELSTRSGTRLGLVAHRDRHVEVVTYAEDDPDECTRLVRLTQEEADTIAEILGAPRITERVADLTKEIPGLLSAQVDIDPGSSYVGKTLGDTKARTRTGASIVAMVHDGKIIVSPGPDQPLAAGDSFVVLGTHEAIDATRAIVGPAES